jgi:hypothetical protein
MPEVQEVLDEHLDPTRNSPLAIRAIYGRWFPWLVIAVFKERNRVVGVLTRHVTGCQEGEILAQRTIGDDAAGVVWR